MTFLCNQLTKTVKISTNREEMGGETCTHSGNAENTDSFGFSYCPSLQGFTERLSDLSPYLFGARASAPYLPSAKGSSARSLEGV